MYETPKLISPGTRELFENCFVAKTKSKLSPTQQSQIGVKLTISKSVCESDFKTIAIALRIAEKQNRVDGCC